MANVKISELAAASTLDGTEEVAVVQSAATVATTVALLRKMPSYTTAGRPAAATAGAGAVIFDTTLGYPTYSNGTNWRKFSDDTNV
jgi:hypothetical protein